MSFAEKCGRFFKKAGHYYQKCYCPPCWFATAFIVAWDPDHSSSTTCFPDSTHYDIPNPISGIYSIYGSCEFGHDITIAIPSEGAQPAHTLVIKSGANSGGRWTLKETFTSGGDLFAVFVASWVPKEETKVFCQVPEYGIELGRFTRDGGGSFTGTIRNPGPIKWRDGVTAADDYFGPQLITPAQDCLDDDNNPYHIDAVYKLLYDYNNGTLGGDFGAHRAFCVLSDLSVVQFPATSASSPPTGCKIRVWASTSRPRCWNQAVYTTPTSPKTTDDTFSLDVSFINPFTGNAADGTHAFGDAQEDDMDTDPSIEFSPSLDPGEVITWSSLTRLAYGSYRFNNLRLKGKKGTRRVNVWAEKVHGTSNHPAKFKIESDDITLNAGATNAVDLKPPNADFSPYLVQIEAALDDYGDPITAHILDSLGNFLLYNVVDGATDTVDLTLGDSGSNGLASSTLHGTSSRAAVDGVASFDDLTATALGRNYLLTVSSGSLNQSLNDNYYQFPISFYIGLAFESLGSVTAGVNVDIKVDLVDATAGIVSPTTVDSLTLSGDGSFTGFGTVAPSSGVATFTGNFPAPGTYTIQVVTSGTTYDGPGTAGLDVVTLIVVVS